jgi:branched-chain amino acid transport system ATP-binding protein
MSATLAAADASRASTITPLLEVQNIEVRYGAALALSGLSLSINHGEVLAVVGANGAGKSTLARAVSGLVPVKAGTISFTGEDITSWRPSKIRQAGLIHLPEGRGVFPRLTVAENLRMAASLVQREGRSTAIERAYEIFPQLKIRRGQNAGTLSGGEQQMLSLARGLVVSPLLIVADEMSLGLAPLMVDVVFASLGLAREHGISILIIEQFVHRALAFADNCIVISRGRAAWTGPAKDAGNEVLREYLGAGEV